MRILHTSDWHIGRTFHGHATLDALRGVLETLTAQVQQDGLQELSRCRRRLGDLGDGRGAAVRQTGQMHHGAQSIARPVRQHDP